jgi:hypothetical protein
MGCGLLQKALHICNGSCLGERRFIQFNLEALFERAHQLDAIERSKIQFLL